MRKIAQRSCQRQREKSESKESWRREATRAEELTDDSRVDHGNSPSRLRVEHVGRVLGRVNHDGRLLLDLVDGERLAVVGVVLAEHDGENGGGHELGEHIGDELGLCRSRSWRDEHEQASKEESDRGEKGKGHERSNWACRHQDGATR
jgi:hypothetical protein